MYHFWAKADLHYHICNINLFNDKFHVDNAKLHRRRAHIAISGEIQNKIKTPGMGIKKNYKRIIIEVRNS